MSAPNSTEAVVKWTDADLVMAKAEGAADILDAFKPVFDYFERTKNDWGKLCPLPWWRCPARLQDLVRRYSPKVRRPRVITEENGAEWRFDRGIEHRGIYGEPGWLPISRYGILVTEERCKIWLSLLAEPTEEVLASEAVR